MSKLADRDRAILDEGSTNGIWELRKESRKTWNYFVTDKTVYLVEPGEGSLEGSQRLAEKYLEGDLWFELHWTTQSGSQGEQQFLSIAEIARTHVRRGWTDKHLQRTAINGDVPMLIERPHFVQLPERVVAIGFPSIVRLKRIDDLCYFGWKQSEALRMAGIAHLGNQKTDVPFIFAGENSGDVGVSQGPRQLIQCGSKARNEVSQGHRYTVGTGALHVDSTDMHLLYGIVIQAYGVWFGVNPLLNLPL